MPLDRNGMAYVNRAAGAQLNKVQPYRIVVHIGAAANARVPAACFFTTAILQLRADATERVMICTNGTEARIVARQVVAALQTASLPAPAAATGKKKAEYSASTPWFNSTVAEVVDCDPKMIDTLRLASRVVRSYSDLHLPHPLSRARRKPYEVVWTFCPGFRRQHGGDREEDLCEPLPKSATDFEVQTIRTRSVRFESPLHGASTEAHNGSMSTGRSCTRLLSVRSSWTGQQWFDLATVHTPQAERERKRADLVRGEWMLEHACLGYSHPWPIRYSERWNILAQAHPATRQLLWPLPWPDLYAEYVPGFLRLDSETQDHYLTKLANASNSPLFESQNFKGCRWHNATAFVTEITMDNLYHALIHAVPTRELFMRLKELGLNSQRHMHLLPHYTQYWPAKGFRKSIGWQMLARSLGVSAAEWPTIAERAQELTTPGRCNCYRRMYGGHAKWMPPPYMKPGKRVAEFRAALTTHVGHPAPKRQILFQLRHNGVRQMSNEAEVCAAIKADAVVGGVVHFEVMEKLSVIEQYQLVSSSRALVGVHGMGLAWSMLLASDAASGSATLEITGKWSKFNRLDYYSMSRANNVHYLRISQRNAPECLNCRRCSYRTCGNITANVTEIIERLRTMVTWLDGSQATIQQ